MTNRKLLLIAYHYPPIQGSTGANRTLAFSRYLKDSGWDVCVLTVRPETYEDTLEENHELIPQHARVERAWGLDTRRSLSIFGRYPGILALPDRWQSWIAGGYWKGAGIARKWRPDIIMSSYPIASAHVLAYLLQKTFRMPWVAEFRDPMLQENYPSGRLERLSFSMVERLVFSNARRVVVTTGGCKEMYLKRFPEWDEQRIETISNGYDPVTFTIPKTATAKRSADQLILLHSGLLYSHERNPTEFFKAVRALKTRGFFQGKNVEFRFRASGDDANYRDSVAEYDIQDLIQFLPRISYSKAVEEMQMADALMIFQADNCNDQIPAKVYEYLYAQKPVIGFADPHGETGQLLKSVGIDSIAKLEDGTSIENAIVNFICRLQDQSAFVVPKSVAEGFSRQNLTADLSRLLTSVAIEKERVS